MIEKKIKKDIYEIEKRQNLLNNEKEKIYDDLLKSANTLEKKKENINILIAMI